MQITAIKASRSPQIVYLFFDNGSFLPLSIDDLIKFKLAKGQLLTPLRYRQVVRLSLFFKVYNYALRRIAASPQTQVLLRPRLTRYLSLIILKHNLSPSASVKVRIVNRTLLKLSRGQLLNDDDFIHSFITKNKNKSRRFLEYHLSRLSFSPGQYLSLLPKDSRKIQHLVTSKVDHGMDLSNLTCKNKLIASLIRRGFSYNEVKTVIDEIIKNR